MLKYCDQANRGRSSSHLPSRPAVPVLSTMFQRHGRPLVSSTRRGPLLELDRQVYNSRTIRFRVAVTAALSGLKSQIFLMRAIVIAPSVADSAERRPSFGRAPLLTRFVLLRAHRRCFVRPRTGNAISVQPAVAVCSGVIAFLQRTNRISPLLTLVFLTILKPFGQQSTFGMVPGPRILTQQVTYHVFLKER